MKERQRWQPEEDALLRAYVKQYGAKEWNLVSQRMGKPLDREAKSCLERWKNYLKPGIKKGSLTPEEQNLVISLQAKYGNKWKKIASQVPGRTAKRLGKWWEVFKEKQFKQKDHHQRLLPSQLPDQHNHYPTDASTTSPTPPSPTPTPTHALQGKYDHILETFAEKYVHPKLLLKLQQPQPSLLPPSLIMPNLSLSDAPPILSLGSIPSTASSSPSALPPWMNAPNMASSGSSLSSASTTPASSVSLSLSPSEPKAHDSVSPDIVIPISQMGTLVQYCKELEEGRQNWLQHKKEAMWRLSRLQQQLESEKNRKRREKMEEMEVKIRCLREVEMAYLYRIETEYRNQLNDIYRDAEAKESKMVEIWSNTHVKLAKIVGRQMGIHHFAIKKNLH